MAIWKARTSTGVRAYFKVVQNGSLVTGLAAGVFTARVINPADSAFSALTVTESAQQAGVYYVDVPSAFLTTHGAGHYGLSIGVHVVLPPLDDEVLYSLEVNVRDIDLLATEDELVVRRATAADGSISTITLDAGASSINNLYRGQKITIISGAGAGQTRGILSYNGTTKVADVARNWEVAPNATSVFAILHDFGPRINTTLQALADVRDINAASVAAIQAGLAVPGSAMALTPGERTTLTNAILDLVSIDGFTLREIMRLTGAALGGKSSGGASDDTVKGVDGIKNRIVTTIDGNGHRTGVTLDLT